MQWPWRKRRLLTEEQIESMRDGIYLLKKLEWNIADTGMSAVFNKLYRAEQYLQKQLDQHYEEIMR